MGKARDVLEALTRASIYEEPDDQLAWQLAYVDNPGLVTLDYHTDLVSNMWLACDDVALRPYPGNTDGLHSTAAPGASPKMRPFNKVTDVFPSVLHFNGQSTGQCDMDGYQRTAWWDQAKTPQAAARMRQREDEFELWTVSRSLYLSRTPFRDLCQ
jgi:hypothetical protein